MPHPVLFFVLFYCAVALVLMFFVEEIADMLIGAAVLTAAACLIYAACLTQGWIL